MGRPPAMVESSGSPKSPRMRQGSFLATDDGPAWTQALHPPPPQTPQREDQSISPVAAGRASPYPDRDPVRPQVAAPGPVAAATTSGPLRPAVGATSLPPPPSSPKDAATRTPSPPSHSSTKPSPTPSRPRTPSPSRSGPSSSSASSLVYEKRFAIEHEATACHNHKGKGPIITLKETGSSDLKIFQDHLDEYHHELVFNSQDRFKEWMYPIVSQFLINEGIVNNAVGGMNATFYTMPPSTKTLEDFLREQGPLVSIQSICDGNFKLCVASGIGMMLVHGFLVYILGIHKHGHTWNGEFSTCDLVVENSFEFRITKISKTGESHCRAADLHRIAAIFKPMFTINEEMALYFDVLIEDLSKVNNGEVEAKWYREYLLSHPALKPSDARYDLECGLHHAADITKTNGDLIPSVFQEGSDWMAIIPPRVSEDKLESGLHTVFCFDHKPNENFSPFAPTVGGLVRYKSHFLQHGQKHIKVQDHTELEQFAAKTFPLALPNTLRGPILHGYYEGGDVSVSDTRRIRGYGYSDTPF